MLRKNVYELILTKEMCLGFFLYNQTCGRTVSAYVSHQSVEQRHFDNMCKLQNQTLHQPENTTTLQSIPYKYNTTQTQHPCCIRFINKATLLMYESIY